MFAYQLKNIQTVKLKRIIDRNRTHNYTNQAFNQTYI